jgi:ATP-dependent Clp protease adapter protein ClpS
MFDQQLEKIIGQTFNKALVTGHAEFSPEHLLIDLIENPRVWRLLTVFAVDHDVLLNKLRVLISKLPTNTLAEQCEPQPSTSLTNLLQELTESAKAANKKKIKPIDVVVAMVKTKTCVGGKLMRGLGLAYDSRLLRYISFGIPPHNAEKRTFELMILNDDYSRFEHVLSVLINDFSLTDKEAMKIAQKIHNEGKAFLGYFDSETAYFLMRRINVYSTIKDQPLLVTLFELGQKLPTVKVKPSDPNPTQILSYELPLPDEVDKN